MNLLGAPCGVLVTLKYKHGGFYVFLFYLEFFLFCCTDSFIPWSWRCMLHDLGVAWGCKTQTEHYKPVGITLQSCMEHRQSYLLSSPCFGEHSPEWVIHWRMLGHWLRRSWMEQAEPEPGRAKVSAGMIKALVTGFTCMIRKEQLFSSVNLLWYSQ